VMNEERILLVDDEQRILAALKARLQDEYKIDTASSAEEGLAMLKETGEYALVISDLHMPTMDGIAFLKKVAESSPKTVRILLTGYVDIPSATRAVSENGLFRYLTKPCSQETVEQTLQGALRKFRSSGMLDL